MSERDETERLARVLEDVQRNLRPGAFVEWRDFARLAAARGVILAPSPRAADKLTPVQEAALAISHGFPNDSLEHCETIARAVLAAAVGALPGGPQPDECSIGSGMERQLVLRAALLAALTEGGEG